MSRLNALLLTAWLSCGLGCHASGPIWLPSDGSASVIVVVLTQGAAIATAHPLGPARGLKIEADREASPTLIALEYERSLDEMHLEEGALHLDLELGAPLPIASQVHRLAPDFEAWQWLHETPPEITALLFSETRPCPVFTPRQRQLPATEITSLELVVPIDPDRLLMSTFGGAFWELGADTERPLPDIPDTTPHSLGLRTPEGELWLATLDGRTAHGTIDRGFVAGPSLPSGVGTWEDITGAPEGLDLYALSSSMAIAHLNGGGWDLIKPATDTPRSFSRPRIAWVEPGTILAIGSNNAELLLVKVDGTIETLQIQLPPQVHSDALYAIERVEGLGVVVATRYDVTFLWVGDRLEPLPTAKITTGGVAPRADVILDLGDRSFLAGGKGELAHWVDGYGVCDPILVQLGGNITAAGLIGKSPALFSMGGDSVLMTVLESSGAPMLDR